MLIVLNLILSSMRMVLRTLEFLEVLSCNACGSDSRLSKVIGTRLDGNQGLTPWRKVGISTTVVKCSKCGLIYCNPLPSKKSVLDTYDLDVDEYWSRSSLKFDSNPDYFSCQSKTALKFLKKSLGTSEKKLRALDVGVGAGKGMRALMNHGFDVDGIEPIPKFRDVAIHLNGIRSTRIQLSTIEDAVLPPASYDFVTFGAVLEHLKNPYDALHKTSDALRSGGFIHFEVPNSRWLVAKIIDFFYRLKITHYTTHLSPLHSPFHLYEFDKKSIILIAKRLGLEIESIQFLVCSQPNIPRLLQPLLRRIMIASETGMQIEVFLRKP